MHTLEEVHKLHGKLLHASLVLPAGCAHLVHLEAMLSIFGDTPFKARTPPTCHTSGYNQVGPNPFTCPSFSPPHPWLASGT